MVVRARPIIPETGELDDACLLTYYGCTPQDWEEAADDKRFVEFLDGRLIVHSPVSLQHARLFGFMHDLLGGFVRRRRLGEILAGPFAMELALERRFEPDLIFICTRTQPNLRPDRLVGPADMAIEIASPSTRAYDRGEKREAYRVGGVREYWMIDPLSRLVTLDRPAGSTVASLGAGRLASETCPGFWVQAEWLWEEPLPDADACLAQVVAPPG